MSTLAERFKEAIGQRKIKLKDLAIAAGVQPPSVSDWLNGETLTLKAETAIKAANFLGVNALWLASGVGTMRGQEADAQGTAAMLQTNTEPGPDIRGSAGSTPTIAGSARAILHFGALSPVRQSAGVRDARARLWELHRAREWANLSIAALVCATPRLDDPTLSPAQIESLRRNLAEIEREADSYKMRFHPVTSVVDGAEHVLQYA